MENISDGIVFITINEFAKRISVSTDKARELSQTKALCERGIAINLDPSKKRGTIRIHWAKYLEYIAKCPAVPIHKRFNDRIKIV